MRDSAAPRRRIDVRIAVVALAVLGTLALGPASAAAATPSCFAPENISAETGDTNLFGGCQDSDGDPVTVSITQQGTKGTATTISTGPGQVSIQYEGTQEGSDTVKFKATAGGEDSPEYTVSIENTPEVNDPPQCFAFGNTPDIEVGDTTTLGFCQDEEGDPIAPTVSDPPGKGDVTFSSAGSIGTAVQYHATAEGDDSFKVKANGGNDAEVTYTTHNTPAVNDAPVCTLNPSAGQIEVGETAFPAACSDDEGSPLTLTFSDGPTKGQTSTQPFGGSTVVGYRADAEGADSFKVKANDGTQDSAQITVTTSNVPAVNDPPSCGTFMPPPIEAEIGEEQSLGSCFDEEQDPMTITITQQGTKGTATVTGNGGNQPIVAYSAATAGADTVKYRATDGNGQSNEVTVTTNNVPATNDPPVCASFFPFQLEVGESTPDTGCFDEEGDPITLSVTQQPTKGTVTFSNNGTTNATGKYTATAVGQDTFKIKATDGTSDSNEVTFTSTNSAASNDLPQCGAGGPVGGTEIGQAVTIGGCIDEEDDNLDVTITQQGTKGTAVVIDDNTPNPTIQYTASAVGADTIKFKANDGTGDSAETTVNTNNVTAANDLPQCGGVLAGDTEVGQTEFIGGCFDEEDDDLSVTITQQGTKGTATVVNNNTPNPSISYTATAVGTDTIKFKANDGTGDSADATATTNNTAAAANAAPTCTGASNRALRVGQSADFACTDADGDTLDVSITEAATRGTVTIIGDNTATPTVRYTATQAGAGGFKFEANDGEDDSNEATVTTVNSVASTTGGNTGGGTGTGTGGGAGGTGGGGGGGNTPSDTGGQTLDPPNIGGSSSAGTAAVSSKGAFKLPQSVDCTGPGPDCAASTSASGSVPAKLASASAKRKTIKLGRSSFKVKSGKKGKVTVKLTKKGLRALKRTKRLKVTVTIKVKRGARTVTKKVRVTLKAPKRR
ncbi:MAG TPA: Ig-like domain-containing protein [Thermoleophilaceae bacterium]|nr:Ig-like domain-containing protein [Thermoleophilaceae bacterium]